MGDLTLLDADELAELSQDQEAWTEYVSGLRRALWPVDPEIWVEDRLGIKWWNKPREIAQSVVHNRRTAVHACHDSGKSHTAACLVCWWLDTHPPGSAFVVTTAPTGDQVKAILWREINRMHKAGGLQGRTNLTEWYLDNELVAIGRKPNDYDPTSFQGIHARYPLVILDEACGIPEELWVAAAALVTNADARMLAIGNPDDPNSHFAKICKPGSGWKVIHIDGHETPNWTGGEGLSDEVLACLLSQEWAADLEAEYGPESPIVVSKVRGRFPRDASDGIVPWSWIQACRSGILSPEPSGVRQLGVDVGAGGDETVLRFRQGMSAGAVWRFRSADASATCGEIVSVIREMGIERVCVDSIGVGWGVYGRLKELADEGEHAADVHAVNVGEAARDAKRFANLKAEIWWEIGRELSRDKAWDLRVVDDQTVAEVIEHKWSKTSNGRIKVEAKEDVKKRLGRSPDNADALMLAFYEPPEEKRRPRMGVL